MSLQIVSNKVRFKDVSVTVKLVSTINMKCCQPYIFTPSSLNNILRTGYTYPPPPPCSKKKKNEKKLQRIYQRMTQFNHIKKKQRLTTNSALFISLERQWYMKCCEIADSFLMTSRILTCKVFLYFEWKLFCFPQYLLLIQRAFCLQIWEDI